MSDTHIVFPEPCHEDWARMSPEGRARLCEACEKRVHDLSQYTPEEADELLLAPAGPACVRAMILPDGRVQTQPSPVGKVLTAALAAPALAAALAALPAAAAPANGAIEGKVQAFDPDAVRITAIAPGVRRATQPNAYGAFRFDDLPPGTYLLKVSVRGGRSWSVPVVAVQPNSVTESDLTDPAAPHVTARPPTPPTPPMIPTLGMPAPRPPPPPAAPEAGSRTPQHP